MTRSQQNHSRWAPKRWFALLTGLWMLLQVSGVHQLCFCGGCEISKVMAQWIPALAADSHDAAEAEHPCCAAARLAEEQEQSKHSSWSSEGDCGCDQESHRAQALNATVEPDRGATVPSLALAMELPSCDSAPAPGSTWAWSATFARGPPPLPPGELYLTQKRLLI